MGLRKGEKMTGGGGERDVIKIQVFGTMRLRIVIVITPDTKRGVI